MDMVEEVRDSLANLCLEECTVDALVKEGFDDMETLVLLDDNDLKTLVPKAGYRKRLEAALKKGQGQGHERGQACVMSWIMQYPWWFAGETCIW